MEKRQLPRGEERLSVLGLGFGGIENCSDAEIEAVISTALAHDINFFDLCCGGKNVYAPFARAIAGQREKVYFQLHFGAVYNESGAYAWTRDMAQIKETFLWELGTLKTDYVDFGFLHCIDEDEDFEELKRIGAFDYVKELHKAGVVRHMGFSSHTPSVAEKVLDEGIFDLMMFSINPAYDYEHGDELGVGSAGERMALYRRCKRDGVGISVMKPFFAGKLLDEKESPFDRPLTHYACLQYALDRPAVLTCVPGVRNLHNLEELLGFVDAAPAEKDYSLISSLVPRDVAGTCVYCNHCQPCPADIDIGLVNKYYDLVLAGDKLAQNHYSKLSVSASACIACGHCTKRCPFGVKQCEKMQRIALYFQK